MGRARQSRPGPVPQHVHSIGPPDAQVCTIYYSFDRWRLHQKNASHPGLRGSAGKLAQAARSDATWGAFESTKRPPRMARGNKARISSTLTDLRQTKGGPSCTSFFAPVGCCSLPCRSPPPFVLSFALRSSVFSLSEDRAASYNSASQRCKAAFVLGWCDSGPFGSNGHVAGWLVARDRVGPSAEVRAVRVAEIPYLGRFVIRLS